MRRMERTLALRVAVLVDRGVLRGEREGAVLRHDEVVDLAAEDRGDHRKCSLTLLLNGENVQLLELTMET